MRVLQGSRRRIGVARDDDQVDMIGHQAITKHGETMEFRVAPEQVEIDEAVDVAAEDDLPGVATLRHVMRNVNDNDARQSGHSHKISGNGHPVCGLQPPEMLNLTCFPKRNSRWQKPGNVPSVPRFLIPLSETRERSVCPLGFLFTASCPRILRGDKNQPLAGLSLAIARAVWVIHLVNSSLSGFLASASSSAFLN